MLLPLLSSDYLANTGVIRKHQEREIVCLDLGVMQGQRCGQGAIGMRSAPTNE